MKDKKIAIIGCGNLGLSIINGLLEQNQFLPNNIIATKRKISSLDTLKKKGVQVTADNVIAVRESKIIILAVKPYNITYILEEIQNELTKDHILISVATGVTLDEISKVIGIKTTIFRAMPNTATDVSASVTAICSKNANEEEENSVKSIFDQMGITISINEELMEAATIMGACGIAFVMRFIRAMIQGGIQIGFDAKTANTIVNQTVKGAAELLIRKGEHPEYEIDKVTTPKGCTIVGLNEMEHNGFSSSLIKGIVTSYEKIEK